MDKLLFGGTADQLNRDHLSQLRDAAAPLEVVVTEDEGEQRAVLSDIVVAVRHVPVGLLAEAPRLRWYQHWYAGVEDIVACDALRERGVMVTNTSGVHATPMTEQVFAMLLSLARGVHLSVRRQVRHEWPSHSIHQVWELAGKTMLVVGLGAVGIRIAELAEAFDMKVIGVRRSPSPDDPVHTVSLADLPRVLPEADVVVCVLPLTDETRGVFDATAFAAMKPGAVFANMGRGGQVDHAALEQALRSGHLRAAALDVTDPEPLPEDSPLWEMEQVVITPHMSGITPAYGSRAWPILFDNLNRFHSGRELVNLINLEAGY